MRRFQNGSIIIWKLFRNDETSGKFEYAIRYAVFFVSQHFTFISSPFLNYNGV